MQTRNSALKAVVCLATVGAALSSTLAFAGGFEKAVMWSGRYAGFSDAAVSSVDNAEALFFNPAGLAAMKGADAVLNFSPTWDELKGPIVLNDRQETSSNHFSPVGSALIALNFGGPLTVGAGYYVSGGSKAIFDNVDFSAVNAGFANLKPVVKSDLTLTEFSLGIGYELAPGLYIGGAWRLAWVNASLGAASTTPAAAPATPATLTNIVISDISATNYNGARAGIQYVPEDQPFGLGVSWRSAINFTAHGTTSGQIITGLGGNPTSFSGNADDTTIKNSFPMQLQAGFFVDTIPNKWRALFQYDWTQYSVNRTLDIDGSFTLPAALGGTTRAVPSIDQSWKNQNNFRFGTQYMLTDALALRAGYILTTAVVPAKAARATFSSPGLGHTVTLGAGSAIMDGALAINGALEYSWASGSVAPGDQTAGNPLTGEYSSRAYALHVGVEYRL